MTRKLLALTLSLALTAGLAACSTQAPAEDTAVPESTAPAAETQTPAADAFVPYQTVHLGLLSGPTGMGAAKMLADNDEAYAQVEAGTYEGGTLLRYEVTLGSDPANDIMPRLTNGELDIAAIPTNLAATLYNRTDGGIKLLALNTLGVLHILENGDTVNSHPQLEGRTLYATGQGSNPEYVLNYLLEANGLDPAADVDIQWLASEELTARMASGDIDLCMLPVPAATTVMMQNSDVRDAIDLNDAWTESGAQGTFTMGCLVARTEWLEDNSELVPGILEEYAASIDYANSNPEEAAALIEQYGIVPKAAVAQAAIPQANMVCITGEDMKGIADYYQVLFDADPTSIGGAIPGEDFYYIP